MEISDLTPTERRVWECFPRGEPVDLRPTSEDEPALGGSWGPERTVRAEVLRALLLNGPRQDGEVAALRLNGARVTGALDVKHGAVDCAVGLRGCYFDAVPHLYGAEIRQLNLSNSVLPGLAAGTIRVNGVLRLTDCRITGPVRLGGAHISRAFFLDRAVIGSAAAARPDGESAVPEPVLQLNHAAIDDDIWGPGLRTDGLVRLAGATIAGAVNLNDAELTATTGTALDAETLSVGSDVHAMRLRARGRINLRGARIPGQLNLSYARLAHPGGTALRASSCTIGELWLRDAAPVEGAVNLRRSQIDLLHVAPDVWPQEVQLDGLTYTTLAPREPAERRLSVLQRDGDDYVPYAYEQLTTAYRRIGDDHAARTVQLAKQRRHRATLVWYARAWGHIQDVTVGYGFRPMRAALWLLSLLLVGSIAYAVHQPRPLKTEEAPDFNPFFYALDLLLPVIDFGQERAFAPEGWLQGLSYLLISTGWILATTVIAGITRMVSRP